MYASKLGRFTTADALYVDFKRLGDPQQINLYIYARNNPLLITDSTGLDIEVTGKEQDDYQKKLQANLSFKVQINPQTHKVEIVDDKGNVLDKKALKQLGKTLKGGEKQLFNAITDKNNHVTIDTVRTDANVFFGRFDGKGKNTIDFGDVDLLDAPANAGGLSSSQVVGHETLEAYKSAQLNATDPVESHGFANQFFGGLEAPTMVKGSDFYDKTNTNLLGYSADFPIYGKSGVNARVTFQFTSPIPVAAIQAGKVKSGSQTANVTKVEKSP